MKMKTLVMLLSYLFTAKALFGLVYLFMGWEAIIETWMVPSWLVIVAIVADFFIAYKLMKMKVK